MRDHKQTCPSCGCVHNRLRGHPLNQCEHSPVRWWRVSRETKYHGREVWTPVASYDLKYVIERGETLRLARPRDLDGLGIETPYSRGPGGRPLCCWCGREVGPRRRTWCGDSCVQDYLLNHDWNHIRRHVYRRDRGICAMCGCDTDEAKRLLTRRWKGMPDWVVLSGALRRIGWPTSPARDWWDADHIHARHLGGADHPDNLRTLCVPCHKRVTAKQARQRAMRKRNMKASLFQESQR